jgi:hypothetical protein
MLIALLLACAGSPSDTGSLDTRPPDFPTWSGTQIGEEGDEGCYLEGEPWADEQSAPPGADFTPAALRESAGGDFSGTLDSAWQGGVDLTATLTLDGEALALTDSLSECPPGLGLSGTLTLSAPDLLTLQTPIALVARDTAVFSVRLDEDALSGELSPGILPDDAGALSLLVPGTFAEGAWSGTLEWWLVLPDGLESAEAGSWSAE